MERMLVQGSDVLLVEEIVPSTKDQFLFDPIAIPTSISIAVNSIDVVIIFRVGTMILCLFLSFEYPSFRPANIKHIDRWFLLTRLCIHRIIEYPTIHRLVQLAAGANVCWHRLAVGDIDRLLLGEGYVVPQGLLVLDVGLLDDHVLFVQQALLAGFFAAVRADRHVAIALMLVLFENLLYLWTNLSNRWFSLRYLTV